MAITRLKLKQLEPSTTPGAIIGSDTSNNFSVLNPTTGADRIWFYDDSATATTQLTLGTNLSITGTTLNASAGAGGYAEIQEEGTPLTARTKFNFIGSAFTAADDAGNTRTNITAATFLNTLATAGAVSLTAHVSGILPVANGGTGIASGTSGGVLYYSAAGTIASSGALTDNIIVVGGGAGATPNSIAAGLGTTTTVLHGNAAGEPTWGAISLTADVSGTLPVANGGTGAATLTGLLQGNGTSAITTITNSSTVGQVLRVTGASTYAWGALDLADTDAVTGTLPATNGGTGHASYAVGDLLSANTTTALSRVAAVATGSVLKSAGVSTLPVWGTLASTDLSNSANIALLNATQTFTGTNTFSNNITMNGTPSASTDVVTVGYINNIVANGLKYHSVRGASTAALTITGRTATTLTIGGTSFVQDGVTFANGEYYLLKDNATGAGGSNADNGAYTVSGVGSAILLTRATYMDAATEIDGHTFIIEDGTANVGTIWITTSEVTTLGTDAIVFTQIQTSGSVTGTGVNNQISVWSGTSSQDGNSTFTWDQTQMTVGTATPATSARVTTQGTGTGNTTYGLVHNNSSATQVFRVADDGTTLIGATNPLSLTDATISRSSGNITLQTSATDSVIFLKAASGHTTPIVQLSGTNTITSGTGRALYVATGFAPTSGTATFTGFDVGGTLNQTGGANGIVRGINIAHTLTAVADYRALEITANSSHYALYTTAGKVRFDLGSDADYDTWYRAATTGIMTRLANGTTGQVLTATTGAAPSWAAPTAQTVTRAYLTGSTSTVIDLDSGTAVTDIDGTNVAFTVPTDLELTFVVRNGVTLSRSGTVARDYTLVSATGVLTLASALTSDESLMVYKIV